MKHSLSNEWDIFHSASGKSKIGIRPREGRPRHPFGDLLALVFRYSNRVQLNFIREFATTTPTWSFQFVDRKWHLTGQGSSMKSGFKICTQWTPGRPLKDEAYKPEFRERNRHGIGILEEANIFWYSMQEYYLETKYQLERKRFCSLPSCPVLNVKKRCSRCKLSDYCTREHQSMHWAEHKAFCRRIPSIEDTTTVFRNLENAGTQRMDVHDELRGLRRKGIDLVSGNEWYID